MLWKRYGKHVINLKQRIEYYYIFQVAKNDETPNLENAATDVETSNQPDTVPVNSEASKDTVAVDEPTPKEIIPDVKPEQTEAEPQVSSTKQVCVDKEIKCKEFTSAIISKKYLQEELSGTGSVAEEDAVVIAPIQSTDESVAPESKIEITPIDSISQDQKASEAVDTASTNNGDALSDTEKKR